MEIKDLDELRSIDELRAYQEDVRSRITAINADSDGLPLKDEARSEFATLVDLDKEIDARCAELEARKAVVDRLAAEPRAKESGDSTAPTFHAPKRSTQTEERDMRNLATLPPKQDIDAYSAEVKSRARWALERAVFSERVDADKARTAVERLITGDRTGVVAERVLRTSDPVYERAFFKRLLNQPLMAHEERVLSIGGGAGGEGGFAVPFTLDPTLILTSDGAVNRLRQISRTVQVTGNEWRGIATDGITASYDAEMTETSDDSPTLVQPVINVHKAQAFVPFSIEIGEDWASMRTEMTRAFQDSKDSLEAEKFMTGAGDASNEPEGLLVGATNTVTATGTGSYAVGDLFALTEALPERYQDNASIAATRAIFNLTRQFNDEGLWAGSFQTGNPSLLLGYPAVAVSGLDSTLANGNSIAVIGDFSRFVIVDRVGLNVELVPHLFGTARNYPNGMRGLYAYWRNGSGVVDANAFRVLITGGS